MCLFLMYTLEIWDYFAFTDSSKWDSCHDDIGDYIDNKGTYLNPKDTKIYFAEEAKCD